MSSPPVVAGRSVSTGRVCATPRPGRLTKRRSERDMRPRSTSPRLWSQGRRGDLPADSTVEAQAASSRTGLFAGIRQWSQAGSNRRPPACKARASRCGLARSTRSDQVIRANRTARDLVCCALLRPAASIALPQPRPPLTIKPRGAQPDRRARVLPLRIHKEGGARARMKRRLGAAVLRGYRPRISRRLAHVCVGRGTARGTGLRSWSLASRLRS
jgi:hypothetical protein